MPLLLFMLLSLPVLGVDALVLSSQVNSAVVTTDEQIRFTVTLDRDASVSASLPEVGAKISGFRVVDYGVEDPKQSEGRIVEELWYILQADISGSYLLPSIQLSYTGKDGSPHEAKTSEIFVEVKAVESTEEGGEDIKDIKPIIRSAFRVPVWAWVMLALVLVGLVVWLVKLRRGRPQDPEIQISPFDRAIEALKRLRQIDGDFTDWRGFHFHLSEVLRLFCEQKFGLPMTDLTYEEIKTQISQLAELDAEERSELLSVLEHCEGVKFADRPADEASSLELWDRTDAFVRAFAPQEQPEEDSVL